MFFREVIGQDELKNKLIKMVKESRVGHAFLFLGKSGYGTLPLSLAFSQYLLCTNKGENDSCGKCNACIKSEKLIHPDINFSMPFNSNESNSNNKSDNFLSFWRELIFEQTYFDLSDWNKKIGIERKQSIINVKESANIIHKMSLKPYESHLKIMLIWSAEKMNRDAANKLLKLIEEPTKNTIIILIAEDKDQILETILSRTLLVNIAPITELDLENYLQTSLSVEQLTAKKISKLAEGDILQANHFINREEEESIFFDLMIKWMRACYEANVPKIYDWVEEISSSSNHRERQKRFLEYLLEIMREAVIRNYNSDKLKRFFNEEDAFLKKFSPFIFGENIAEINELINQAYYHINRNAYAKIVFMDMSMQFANLLRAKNRTFVS